jgi:hypothetical protein
MNDECRNLMIISQLQKQNSDYSIQLLTNDLILNFSCLHTMINPILAFPTLLYQLMEGLNFP